MGIEDTETDRSARLLIAIKTSTSLRVVRENPLRQGDNTIGLRPDMHVSLSDPALASPHAILNLDGDRAVLTFLVDSPPVILDGEKYPPPINRPRQLDDGASFSIGVFVLTYRAAARTEHTEAPVAIQPNTKLSSPDPQLITDLPIIDSPPLQFALPPRIEWQFPLDSPFSRYLVEHDASRYIHDLPTVYQGGEHDFLGRYLKIFESIWEPFEWRQDQIAMYFDPRTCPLPLLAWLEHWMGVSFSSHWPEERRRRLLVDIYRLYRWRGTEETLRQVIAIYTGIQPQITPHASPFVIEIDPKLPADHAYERAVIDALIHMFKPAHIGYHLNWSDARG